jgi:CRISPR-associated protein Csy2
MNHSILLIPRLRIHNANALSSPYSIGFPAITAWLGAVHALERKLKQSQGFDDEFEELHFPRAGVVCHDFKLHTYKAQDDFNYSIVSTGNPLDKNGKRPSFIEEARCELSVSLLIEYDTDDDGELVEAVSQLLPTLKMASGDIESFGNISTMQIRNEAEYQSLIGAVMPGFCLIDRSDLMKQAMQEGQDAIDALLDCLKVTHSSELDENEKVTWTSKRREKGWIVPIATGFHGITDLGIAENQRDSDTLHRFAESVVTLGEFVMPYRITDLDQMLWYYHPDIENKLYLCQQNQSSTQI